MKLYLIIFALFVIPSCSEFQNPAGIQADKVVSRAIVDTPMTFRTKFILKPNESQAFSHLDGNLQFRRISYFMLRNLTPGEKNSPCNEVQYSFRDGNFFAWVSDCLMYGDSITGLQPSYDMVAIENLENNPMMFEVFIRE